MLIFNSKMSAWKFAVVFNIAAAAQMCIAVNRWLNGSGEAAWQGVVAD